MLAERDGHWVLARTYAERAKTQYEELADRANVGRLLNNLGAARVPARQAREAVEHLKQAFAVALELGRDEDAATAVSSLAQVHLRTGDVEKAEEQARHALELLGGREDMLDEIGNARLVLGRALLEQGRLDEADDAFDSAEDAFAKLVVGLAPRRRVGGAGRSRDKAWRRAARGGAVPACSRIAPGLPVLRKGGVHCGNPVCEVCSAAHARRARIDRRGRRDGSLRSFRRDVGRSSRRLIVVFRPARAPRWGAGGALLPDGLRLCG